MPYLRRSIWIVPMLAAMSLLIVGAAPAARFDNGQGVRHRLTLQDERGAETNVEVFGWSHEIVSPRDAASGLPTGKRQHKPLTITKAVDKATPLLLQSLLNNRVHGEVVLESFRKARGGWQLFRTIRLTEAFVSSYNPVDILAPERMQNGEREHVAFTYQKIIWTFEEGGVEAEDDWETPVV